MTQKTEHLVLNIGALLGSCKVEHVTGSRLFKTLGLDSRINSLGGFGEDKELFPAAARAAVIHQFGFATAGTGPAAVEGIVQAAQTDVSVSTISRGHEPAVSTVVELKARVKGLQIGNVLTAESISIEAVIHFDTEMNDATITFSGAFQGLKIAGEEFSVQVRSEVAKPLWNSAHLTALDAKQMVLAELRSHLSRRAAELGDADRGRCVGFEEQFSLDTGTPLQASRHSFVDVSAAAHGGHGGTRLSGNIVSVEHRGDVGRVVVGDLLAMRTSKTPLWLELAVIRAEFTQFKTLTPLPFGGGGTHDDGSQGGGP